MDNGTVADLIRSERPQISPRIVERIEASSSFIKSCRTGAIISENEAEDVSVQTLLFTRTAVLRTCGATAVGAALPHGIRI